MKVSCVILNYNDADTVRKLAEQIGSYEVFHQIIVVDNDSADDSRQKLEQLEQEMPGLRLVCAERNGGYGAGNNLGVRAAAAGGADHVVIVNPDVSFSEDCVRKMLRVFASHPDVAVVTASMMDAQFGRQRNGWPLRGFMRELLSMGPVSRRIFRPALEYPESRFAGKKAAFVDAVHGSMLMVDTGKFLECGGYDEQIFLYQEEAVLAQRLRTGGYRSVLLLNCSYRHEHSVSISRTFAGQLERQRLREKSVLYYLRHYLYINPLQERIARLWFWGIRMEIRAAQLLERLMGR